MKYVVSKQKASKLEKLMESRNEKGSETVVFETLGETEDGKIIISMEILTAISETPWQIIGRKTATDEKFSAGVSKIEDGYREPRTDMRCMECKRKAGTLVIIRNRTTGEILQVGRECLKKFMGRDADLLGLIAEEEPFIDNEWGISGFNAYAVSLSLFLHEAQKDIAERGYVKYDPYADRDAEKPTKQTAWWNACSKASERAAKNLPIEEEEETAYLEKIRNWAKAKDASKSEFWQNVQNILSGETVRKKHVGFIACLPDILNRDEKRSAEKAKREIFLAGNDVNDSEFAPVKNGDKVDIEAILERKGGYESFYGWTEIMTFRGKDGFAYVWKTKTIQMWTIPVKDAGDEFYQVGDRVKLKGTVKEQSVYKDMHQTVLTRCKLSMIEPKEKPFRQTLMENIAKKEASNDAEEALDTLMKDWES